VKQWWESEIPDEELPAKVSRREIVDRYFERVSHEWLETLSQVTVE
jgi:hypothetical protein